MRQTGVTKTLQIAPPRRAGLWAALGLLLAVLFAVAPTGALSATARGFVPPLTTLPYRIDYGGWITVPVMIDGRGPFDFVVDTGASRTLIFKNLAVQLAIPNTPGETVRILGVGSQARLPTYRVGDVAVGSVSLDDLSTVILDDWRVGQRTPQGVLGLDFLARYLLAFDAETMTVAVYSPGAEATLPPKWRPADLKRDNFGLEAGEIFVAKTYFRSRPVELLFDLGASGTVINSIALGSLFSSLPAIVARPTGAELTSKVTDILNEASSGKLVKIDRIRLGKTTWYRQTVTVHDAAIFDEIGRQNVPFGLLGADLFRDRSFALDFPNDRLWIGPKRKDANKDPVHPPFWQVDSRP